MSLGNNPSIVTNGLTFYYDMNNPNSYRSPPLRNVLTEISPRGQGDSSTYKFSNGTENVYIPNLGFIPNCAYMDMYNDYNGGSNNCCPSPYGYGQGLSVSGSTEYTYAIVYKSVNGYTNANYMYHYEYNGGSYITEYGLFYSNGTYSGQVRHLGDDWYWASSKFTTNASCNLFYTGAWMYEYARYNRLYVAKAMIVQGDYTNLHPRFWPDLNTTVSNTQALFDLTGQNTITVTSLTYNNDGTFKFDGVDDYIDSVTSSGLTGTGAWSMEAWFKVNGAPSNATYGNVIVDTDATGGSANMIVVDYGGGHGGSQNQILYATRPSTGGGYTLLGGPVITQGVYYHAIVVRNGSTDTKLYINGSLNNTYSGNMPTATQALVRIGRWTDGTVYSNTTIPAVRIYNRELTAGEVTQNFAAQRGLYGV
jgi:hypothetical protein